jgi:hypothetical protein
LRPTAEDEPTFEVECVLVSSKESLDTKALAELVEAA